MAKSTSDLAREFEKKLDAVQAARQPVPVKIYGVPAVLIPQSGNSFRIRVDSSEPDAGTALERLKAMEDVRNSPIGNGFEAVCTWDTTLHLIAAMGHLEFRRPAAKTRKNG